MIIIETINSRIKYIRENIIQSDQEVLANYFRMSKSNYSSIETGRINPSLAMILILSEYDHISPKWILLGVGEIKLSHEKNFEVDFIEPRMRPQQRLKYAEARAAKIMGSIPGRIRVIRRMKKFSQKELARNLTVGQTTISSIENSTNQPTVDIIIKISEFLKIDLDDLLGDNERFTNFLSYLSNDSEALSDENLSKDRIYVDVTELTEKQIELVKALIYELKLTKE